MNKRLIALMAILRIGMLTACGTSTTADNSAMVSSDAMEADFETSEGESMENSVKTTAESQENSSQITATESADDEGSKVLVVYYSASGNTENAANYIAKATGADTFELVPVEPYTNEDLDWTKGDSRVSVEHDNEDQRSVELTAVTVDNWDSYDTVFIGYPIWWGIAAWPVDEFIVSNDFSRKTVIPFCTSASSGIGQSGELLAQMAGTGDWQEGERFKSNFSESDVDTWVKGLNF